jgi:DNA polymerase-3 subunit epsilon/oligoribonuclease
MLCIQEYSSLIQFSEREWTLSSDTKALAINGITFEEVRNAKTHNEVCEDLAELFLTTEVHKRNAAFICQNPSFDRTFFNQIMPLETQEELELPYHWLDLASMYFARSLDVEKPINGHNLPHIIRLSKDAIASYLGIPPEKTPHRATNGVHHLIACYRSLFRV